MLLSIGFGGVALFLAAIGIYGVLAYVVAQRTEEIGIRIALGSTAEALFRLILKEGGVMLGIGFVLGLAGALAVGQVGRGRPLRSEARESRRAGRDDRHSGARGLCTAGQAGHPGDPAITLRQE